MSYSYGMRFDDDSNAITVIDEENQTATTKGFINGEPVDFGGGDGGVFHIVEGVTTYQEVFDAMAAGKICIVYYNDEDFEAATNIAMYANSTSYKVFCMYYNDGTVEFVEYVAESANAPLRAE